MKKQREQRGKKIKKKNNNNKTETEGQLTRQAGRKLNRMLAVGAN